MTFSYPKPDEAPSRFLRRSYAIAAGQAISLAFEHGTQLHVLRGRVWVTMGGVADDFWLGAGESLPLLAGRSIVIEADREEGEVEIGPGLPTGPAPGSAGKMNAGGRLEAKSRADFQENWVSGMVKG